MAINVAMIERPTEDKLNPQIDINKASRTEAAVNSAYKISLYENSM